MSWFPWRSSSASSSASKPVCDVTKFENDLGNLSEESLRIIFKLVCNDAPGTSKAGNVHAIVKALQDGINYDAAVENLAAQMEKVSVDDANGRNPFADGAPLPRSHIFDKFKYFWLFSPDNTLERPLEILHDYLALSKNPLEDYTLFNMICDRVDVYVLCPLVAEYKFGKSYSRLNALQAGLSNRVGATYGPSGYNQITCLAIFDKSCPDRLTRALAMESRLIAEFKHNPNRPNGDRCTNKSCGQKPKQNPKEDKYYLVYVAFKCKTPDKKH